MVSAALEVLGWSLEDRGGADLEARERLAWKALGQTRASWNRAGIGRMARARLVVSRILPCLMWGSSAWVWSKETSDRVVTIIRALLKTALGRCFDHEDGLRGPSRLAESSRLDAIFLAVANKVPREWAKIRATNTARRLATAPADSLLARAFKWRNNGSADPIVTRTGVQTVAARRKRGRPPRRWEHSFVECLGVNWWTNPILQAPSSLAKIFAMKPENRMRRAADS